MPPKKDKDRHSGLAANLNSNLQVRDINLSQYASDGTREEPPPAKHWSIYPLEVFLSELTRELNREKHVATLGFYARCITAPPKGYTYHVSRNGNPQVAMDAPNEDLCFIYGHPNGPFRSFEKFADHIVSIIKDDLANCTCLLCTGPPAPGPPPPLTLPDGPAEPPLF